MAELQDSEAGARRLAGGGPEYESFRQADSSIVAQSRETQHDSLQMEPIRFPLPSDDEDRDASLRTNSRGQKRFLLDDERQEDAVVRADKVGQRFRKIVYERADDLKLEKETNLPARLFGEDTVTDDDLSDKATNSEESVRRRKKLLEHADERSWLRTEFSGDSWFKQILAMTFLAILCVLLANVVSIVVGWAWDVLEMEQDWNTNVVLKTLILAVTKTAWLASGIMLTFFFSPDAAGSGIPELKAILSGIWIRKYLSRRTLVLKALTLSLVLGSGLPIGLEGPFIHMAAILGRQILHRIKFFHGLNRNTFLTAACAVSISSTFGSPVGGVLFSIEVTRSYYMVDTYFAAFSSAAIGALLVAVITALAPTSLLLFEAHSSFEEFANRDLPIYLIIGLLAGLLGGLFSRLHPMFAESVFGSRRLRAVVTIALVLPFMFTCIAMAFGDFAVSPMRVAVHDLFNARSLEECETAVHQTCRLDDWAETTGWVCGQLIYLLIQNFVLTEILMVLPMPVGTFGPVFTIGATLGRLIGELFKFNKYYDSIIVGDFAVAGAAAMTAGVTQTLSPAVIAMELTKRQDIAVPVLAAVCIAWNVSRIMGPSIYDEISDLMDLPYLPFEPRQTKHPKSNRPYIALDVMNPDLTYVPAEPTINQLNQVLNRSSSLFFPVVHLKHPDPNIKGIRLDSNQEMVLVGEVSRQVLEQIVKSPKYQPTSVLPDDAAVGDDQMLSLLETPHVDHVHLSPLQVMASTPLPRIYILFHVLRVDKIYVTQRNLLIGEIEERELIKLEKRKT